ncbi:glycosyltransferase 87 family protein [Agromyces sp. MMS24-JH15]|uniref:glycosyltransferase 87 family protein n=1 Tax=Agromyces sp. MMS24-JH15 TaxID=3243765 RepID=UPI00374A7A95
MADADTVGRDARRRGIRLKRALRSRWLLWLAFLAVHALLVGLNLGGVGWPLGDVEVVYLRWAENAEHGFVRMGIDAPWVYPILAFAPMAAALAFGASAYPLTWLGIVTVLDGVAFSVLLGRARPSRTRFAAAWWWIAFLALLGPIALGRIDAVTVPFAILGLLWAIGRPRVAAVLLTIGAWIKVWPAALLAAIVVAHRRRGEVAVIAAALSIGIVAACLVAGAGTNVFGFVLEQTDRGMQVEAPIAVAWLWRIATGDTGVRVYYDRDILTYQVDGPGAEAAAALTTPALALGVLAVLLVGIRAAVRGANAARLLPPLAVGFVAVLTLANKVGSPQFATWIAAPVILAIVVDRAHALVPSLLALGVAATTHVIYPYWYAWLLVADPAFVAVLTVKVVLVAGLLAWSVARVWRIGGARRPRVPDHPRPSRADRVDTP